MDTYGRVSTDQYFRPILNVEQGIDLLLEGKNIDSVLFEECVDVDRYNQKVDELSDDGIALNEELYRYGTAEEFLEHATSWNIPEKYLKLDIEEYLVNLCTTDEELIRVAQELVLFKERGLYIVLQTLVYIIDTFRENGVVWGVGRGSSVASYCLFLIGVHKIDSIRFNLDIGEFLK